MVAAISIRVQRVMIKAYDRTGDWSEGLIFHATAFVLPGLFSLGFNVEDRMEATA